MKSPKKRIVWAIRGFQRCALQSTRVPRILGHGLYLVLVGSVHARMKGLQNMYNGDRLQSSHTFIQSKCMHGSWRLLVTQGGFARCQLIHMKTNNLRSSLTATLLHTSRMLHLNPLYWATLEDQLGFDRQHHVEGQSTRMTKMSSHFHVLFLPSYVNIVQVHCCFIRHTEKFHLLVYMNSASALKRTASFSKGY